MNMENIILKAENLSKSYEIKGGEKNLIFSGINFDLEKGKSSVIKGPSGVGKSTFLYIVGSIEHADMGDVSYFDDESHKHYFKMSENELDYHRNRNIGFVFQFHHLLPEFTALENVMIPGMIRGSNQKDLKNRAMQLLDRVGLNHRVNHKPSELSGGEQQRAAIARSLINNPKILLADEPTGNLDAKNTANVLDIISEIQKDMDLTMLITTHSNEVAKNADLVYEMSSKEITLI